MRACDAAPRRQPREALRRRIPTREYARTPRNAGEAAAKASPAPAAIHHE
jgi:hypothetical protein